MKDIRLVRYLLMIPASVLAGKLLTFLVNDKDCYISAICAFLGTFEFIMPKKNIWFRLLNILFCIGYIIDNSKSDFDVYLVVALIISSIYLFIAYWEKIKNFFKSTGDLD